MASIHSKWRLIFTLLVNWPNSAFGWALCISCKDLETKSRLGFLVIFLLAEGNRIGNFHRESVYEVKIHITPGIIEMSITVWGLPRADDDICNYHREWLNKSKKVVQIKLVFNMFHVFSPEYEKLNYLWHGLFLRLF